MSSEVLALPFPLSLVEATSCFASEYMYILVLHSSFWSYLLYITCTWHVCRDEYAMCKSIFLFVWFLMSLQTSTYKTTCIYMYNISFSSLVDLIWILVTPWSCALLHFSYAPTCIYYIVYMYMYESYRYAEANLGMHILEVCLHSIHVWYMMKNPYLENL